MIRGEPYSPLLRLNTALDEAICPLHSSWWVPVVEVILAPVTPGPVLSSKTDILVFRFQRISKYSISVVTVRTMNLILCAITLCTSDTNN